MAVLLVGIALLAVQSNASAEPNAALTLGKTLIGEGDDFATEVIGLPWDMKTGPYPGPTTVFRQDIKLSTIEVEDGRWKFTSIDEDENDVHAPLLWMLWTGIEGTQDVLRIGDRFPINTDKYKIISLYFCSDRFEYGIFYWFYTHAPHDPEDPEKTGFSEFFDIEQGCHFYSLDMTQYPLFQGDWDNTSFGYPNGLRFKPQALTSTNADFELDWFRVTSKSTENVVPLQWSGVTPGSTLHFYASRNGCSGEAIPLGTQNAGGTSGTFNWGANLQYWETGRLYALPSSLEPDFYHIYMLVNNAGSPVCAGPQLEIRAAPIAWVTKPSMLSGPEYSTEVRNDTWGFSNDDVLDTNHISQISFSGGQFHGHTTGEGVWLLLNENNPDINTTKYKYISFRMFVEGFQTLAGGWLARFFWWDIGPGTDPNGTAGQIISEGWHSYSIDMTEALMLPDNTKDWEGAPDGFRFDPLEPQGSKQYDFHLDYLIITGDESVYAGTPFEVIVDVVSESATSATLYYDNDTNPNNGRTPMNTLAMETPLGQYFLFIPSVQKFPMVMSDELPELPGFHTFWNTTGIAPGAYYVSVDVSDGVNTTTWYSEIPLIIK